MKKHSRGRGFLTGLTVFYLLQLYIIYYTFFFLKKDSVILSIQETNEENSLLYKRPGGR